MPIIRKKFRNNFECRPPHAPQKTTDKNKEKQKQLRYLKKEVRSLEKKIDAQEAALKTAMEGLQQTSSHEERQSMARQAKALEEDLQKSMSEWETQSQILDAHQID